MKIRPDLKALKDAIYYMNMAELKAASTHLGLSSKGMKGEIILRILTFIETGKILETKEIPVISRAKKGETCPLKAGTKILFGNYKNDLATRQFIKTLVGHHFHFTAFGQDWIKSRWLAGDPPTYAEFAEFWNKEHQLRKTKKAQPKQEWALLNFTQRYLKNHPQASKSTISKKWKALREEKAALAKSLLSSLHRER